LAKKANPQTEPSLVSPKGQSKLPLSLTAKSLFVLLYTAEFMQSTNRSVGASLLPISVNYILTYIFLISQEYVSVMTALFKCGFFLDVLQCATHYCDDSLARFWLGIFGIWTLVRREGENTLLYATRCQGLYFLDYFRSLPEIL
jgi:hypothetical protein